MNHRSLLRRLTPALVLATLLWAGIAACGLIVSGWRP